MLSASQTELGRIYIDEMKPSVSGCRTTATLTSYIGRFEPYNVRRRQKSLSTNEPLQCIEQLPSLSGKQQAMMDLHEVDCSHESPHFFSSLSEEENSCDNESSSCRDRSQELDKDIYYGECSSSTDCESTFRVSEDNMDVKSRVTPSMISAIVSAFDSKEEFLQILDQCLRIKQKEQLRSQNSCSPSDYSPSVASSTSSCSSSSSYSPLLLNISSPIASYEQSSHDLLHIDNSGPSSSSVSIDAFHSFIDDIIVSVRNEIRLNKEEHGIDSDRSLCSTPNNDISVKQGETRGVEGTTSNVKVIKDEEQSERPRRRRIKEASRMKKQDVSKLSHEEMCERKRQQNRLAAQRYRSRIRSERTGEQKEVDELEKRNSQLRKKYVLLTREINKLKKNLLDLQ